MRLTISKRFEFASSHRLGVASWPDKKNNAFFGKEAQGRFGHGHNYAAYFVFSGPVDEKTGMLINVTVIKERIKKLIDSRFDHKFLNIDTPPFDQINPTAENLAAQLLEEAKPLFSGYPAHPVVCHLEESPFTEATAYADGTVERHLRTDFSVARRTWSPFLSDEENRKLFGSASSPTGHGHHYRLKVTLSGDVDPLHGLIFPIRESREILKELHSRYDHKNLSTDIPRFKEIPNTTEMIAQHLYDELKKRMPVVRLRLDENDNFGVAYSGTGNGNDGNGNSNTSMIVSSQFYAAHRLHSRLLSDGDNVSAYGICNNRNGHGHLYRVECTVNGPVDERSGTVYDLGKINSTLDNVLEEWDYKHLDLETDDFKDRTSTSENIVQILNEKLAPRLEPEIHRLRIWETGNNRFTLRK
ncbi:MAG: hypothetical protein GY940_23850 [bacterium]|nr:hypothetical protein [bacterium]